MRIRAAGELLIEGISALFLKLCGAVNIYSQGNTALNINFFIFLLTNKKIYAILILYL